MRLSKPEEDPEVEPDFDRGVGGDSASVVEIQAEEMSVEEAVEKLDDDLDEAFDEFHRGRAELREAIEELQEGVEQIVGVLAREEYIENVAEEYAGERSVLDEEKTL
jgi:exonuclease VII small subunit